MIGMGDWVEDFRLMQLWQNSAWFHLYWYKCYPTRWFYWIYLCGVATSSPEIEPPNLLMRASDMVARATLRGGSLLSEFSFYSFLRRLRLSTSGLQRNKPDKGLCT